MKKITQILFISFLLATVLWSCTKKENTVSYTGGTAPILTTNLSSDSIPLSPNDSASQALSLSWTNPNYVFSNGVSSLSVSYDIEFDTLANFSSANQGVITVSAALSTFLSVGQINAVLVSQMKLSLDTVHTIYMRLKSYIPDINTPSVKSLPLYSDTFNFKVVPYLVAAVNPPATYADNPQGNLFIVGSATPGGGTHGWDNPISQSVSAQQFTKLSNVEYTITIPLIGGGEYKFIGVNGSWNDQWSVAITDDPTELNGGAFVFNGQNALAPATSGTYVIDVNFQTGMFTVTPQ